MGTEHEKAFEDEICAHLAGAGWHYLSKTYELLCWLFVMLITRLSGG